MIRGRHAGCVYSITYSPNRQYIISGSSGRTVQVWNAETGAAVGQRLKGHGHTVWSIAYSPDGQYIVFEPDDKTIHV